MPQAWKEAFWPSVPTLLRSQLPGGGAEMATPLGRYPRGAQRPRLATAGPDPSTGQSCCAVCPRLVAGLPALAPLSPDAHVLRGTCCQVDSGPAPRAVKPSTPSPGCPPEAMGGAWAAWPLSCARSPRFVILSVVLFGLVYNPHEACSLNLVDHGRGYLGILLSCMIAEMAIIWLSMRGGILYTEPRESMQYVLYVRLGKGPLPWVRGPLRPTPTPTLLLGPAFFQPHTMGWALCQHRGQQRMGRLTGPASGPGVGRLRPEGQVAAPPSVF